MVAVISIIKMKLFGFAFWTTPSNAQSSMLRNHSWKAQETIWGARYATHVDCVQGKCSTSCPITPA